jgi:predicted dehydrogenase
MSRTLGVVVVGYGFMGSTHLAAWRLVPEATIRAVVGRNREKAAQVAEPYGAAVYGSLDEALAQEGVDVVDICTPTHLHEEQAVRAAEAGKHVLVEKPMALTLKQADRMIAAAREAGVKLMVAQVLRFFPEYMKAAEVVFNGAVGEPVTARCLRAAPLPGWGSWFTREEESGGVMLDMAIHDVDFLRWVFRDEVDRVYAQALRVQAGVETDDHAYLLLHFKGGGIAHVEVSWAVPGNYPFTMALDLIGTQGRVAFNNHEPIPVTVLAKGETAHYAPESLPWRPMVHPFPIDPYYREIRHFADSILQDREPAASGEEARRSLEVCLAAKLSAREGRPVDLPLQGEV